MTSSGAVVLCVLCFVFPKPMGAMGPRFFAAFHQLLMETKCEKAMGKSIIPLEKKLWGGLRSISLSHQLFQISENSLISIIIIIIIII
jgi:hypothetical protein